LRSFQDRLDEFTKRRVRILAISVDPPAKNQEHRQKVGLSFPLLSDEKAEVIRAYDLLHERASPEGQDIARPAEFLVDPNLTVRWANLTSRYTTRARPEQVLEAIDRMGSESAATEGR
jgi:peroxiredoxin